MNMPASGSLDDIMEKNGRDFVQACYLNVLQREADPEGLASHLAALERGLSKAQIIASIANSDEACLNNMATSKLAKSARRQAFQEKKGAFGWPFKKAVSAFVVAKQTQALVNRRKALLDQISAGQTGIPVGAQKAAETIRVPAADWRDRIAKNRKPQGGDQHPRYVNNLWFDLTTALQWHGGVVGIVRAELEMACGLARIYPDLRFSMQIDQGFSEIAKDELQWLLEADNVADAYMHFFARYKGATEPSKAIHVQVPDVEEFFHPYEPGDAVIAVGWMDSQKERYFSLAKQKISDLSLFYLIYDIILLLDETRHFYDPVGRQRFESYVKWVSNNCDLIFYGGRTAQIDTEALQQGKGWPTPPGVPVKFGTDIVKASNTSNDTALLNSLGIKGDFIITVGSLEPRKNHETLYRAYLMALEMVDDDLPQLVFIGKPMWRVDDMLDTISRNPRLNGRLLCLTPTDTELAALYRNCRFTALPSLYEGWSLTLPESLGQGKFCLCSATPPLREIGGDLVDYVDPYDVRGWAEKIILYSKNDSLLRSFEQKISNDWPTMKWSDTAQMLIDAVRRFEPKAPSISNDAPTVWMDLTMSFLEWDGGISGIVRAELEYARHIKTLDKRTRFFAFQRGYEYFFEIDDSYLDWLFASDDLSAGYNKFRDYWHNIESNNEGHRNPFRHPGRDGKSYPGHQAYLSEIPNNSIIFFAGIDSDGTGVLSRVSKIDELITPNKGIMRSQVIYDLTPILTPQFHVPTTCIGFESLFKHVSNHYEHITYGGRTAQRDGILIQNRESFAVPPSDFVEFGSDIAIGGYKQSSAERDEQLLHKLGITGDFIITVGTIEPRKNHEVLYKAYLTILKKSLLNNPLQMIFVGKKGWKSHDFLASLEQDDRVQGKILIMSPNDEELDVLYRHCKFTLLPSFYEGWSLTLPESLSYGKLCLTSDVDPLRETGRDLVEYIHPLDTAKWAERIAHYANNPAALNIWNERIRAEWTARTWRESAEMLLGALRSAHADMLASKAAALSKKEVA